MSALHAALDMIRLESITPEGLYPHSRIGKAALLAVNARNAMITKCTGNSLRLKSSANCLMELREARSSDITMTSSFPVLLTMSSRDSSARWTLRHARITRAPAYNVQYQPTRYRWYIQPYTNQWGDCTPGSRSMVDNTSATGLDEWRSVLQQQCLKTWEEIIIWVASPSNGGQLYKYKTKRYLRDIK